MEKQESGAGSGKQRVPDVRGSKLRSAVLRKGMSIDYEGSIAEFDKKISEPQ